MGQKPLKPDYNPEKIQNELIELCRSLCVGDERNESLWRDAEIRSGSTMSFRRAANELGISVSKVIKLLITGGYYTSDICGTINELSKNGKSVLEIQEILSVSRATVQAYLPYKKGVYLTHEVSVNADRIRVYRERTQCIEDLQDSLDEKDLWQAVILFQGYPFYTASGLKFDYELKKGRNGSVNKELIVSRRTESKTLAWSSVRLAFEKALEMQGQVIDRPKALGDIRGISYIYPMLYRFGIIEVPEKTAEKMQLKGGNNNRKPNSME